MTPSAEEIFETAMEMEKRGARFYRAAAASAAEPETAALFSSLAKMEDEHLAYFTFQRNSLSARERLLDLEGDGAAAARALANGKVFPKEGYDSEFTGKESPAAVLKRAIGLEKDSVIFYLALKESVRNEADKQRLDGIIREEMGHLNALSKALEARGKP